MYGTSTQKETLSGYLTHQDVARTPVATYQTTSDVLSGMGDATVFKSELGSDVGRRTVVGTGLGAAYGLAFGALAPGLFVGAAAGFLTGFLFR